MRIKKGFSLRQLGNECIVIANGKENVDFTSIISLNDSAARLWKEVVEKEFSVEELGNLLLEWYDTDETTAMNDARALAHNWFKAGIAEE